jgi:Domain of unknown function (DUF4452)
MSSTVADTSLVIDSSVAARYEAAKSFDLEDDLEYCPVLTMDEVITPLYSPHWNYILLNSYTNFETIGTIVLR